MLKRNETKSFVTTHLTAAASVLVTLKARRNDNWIFLSIHLVAFLSFHIRVETCEFRWNVRGFERKYWTTSVWSNCIETKTPAKTLQFFSLVHPLHFLNENFSPSHVSQAITKIVGTNNKFSQKFGYKLKIYNSFYAITWCNLTNLK